MKGRKKWLIALALVTALGQALVTFGVAPPVLADVLLTVGDALLPPDEQAYVVPHDAPAPPDSRSSGL